MLIQKDWKTVHWMLLHFCHRDLWFFFQVQVNSNGTVRYCDFLDKFYGMTHDSHVGQEKWVSGTHK